MNTLITWAVANPTYAFLLGAAALWLLIGCAMDEAERAQGMDDDPYVEAEIQRRVTAGIAPVVGVQEYALSIREQMVADGLIRDPGSHTRLGDA